MGSGDGSSIHEEQGRQRDAAADGFAVETRSGEVVVWGPAYIPFEPRTEEQTRARSELREALASLSARPREVLHACYAGPRPANADVENILLYNIGGRCFDDASRWGVRFEEVPQGVWPDAGWASGCLYRYQCVSPDPSLQYWRSVDKLASFQDVDLGAFASEHRAAQTWLALHRNRSLRTRAAPVADVPFAITLYLSPPASVSTRLRPELVKSLIDGVVSALQAHRDPASARVAATLLASRVQAAPNEIETYLCSTERAVLGVKGQLVRPFRSGLKWDPSDHLCVAGGVLREESVHTTWRLSGEVDRVEPRSLVK